MKVSKSRIESLFDLDELNVEDIKNLHCSESYLCDFVKKNNTMYHMRVTSLVEATEEIIGELISEYFKLDTVHSIFYKDEENYYALLTEVFTTSDNKYGFIEELFLECAWAEDLCALKSISRITDPITYEVFDIKKECLKKLLIDLKKLIIRDFITNQTDRHSENFMFCYDKDYVKLMPVYDYEHSFVKSYEYENTLLCLNLNRSNVLDFVRNDDTFQELLEKALLLDMKSIFKRLKSEYFIILNSVEKWEYESVVTAKQNEIKQYKLIR